MKIVCLLSGGIDSTTLLFRLKKNRHDVIPLFINYGQKAAKKEYEASQKACKILGIKLNVIDIPGLSIISSGLTTNEISPIDTPVFPNRNLILLSVGAAFAQTNSCQMIAIGLIEGTNFSDQTKEFVKRTELSLSTEQNITILAPMIELNKLEVVRLAIENRIPLDFTYSCYFGLDEPCNECLSCKDRLNAFMVE